MPIKLDKTDKQLLNLMQQDNKMSAEILAEKVGSSRSSVQRRIQRLRNEGAIAADISILSDKITRDKILAIVEVKLETVRSDLLDDFKKSMLSLPAVQQCYFVTGKVDFIVILSVDNLKEYEAVTRQHFADNKNVARYHSNIVADCVKQSLQIPLAEIDI